MGLLIEISGHHALNEMHSYQYGGCNGYDERHTQVVVEQAHKIFRTAEPETTIKLITGPDRSCAACPLNKTGKRFDKTLTKRKKRKPCKPDGKKVASANTSAIGRVRRMLGKPKCRITAGDFQEWRERYDDPFGYFRRDVLEKLVK
jgi:hypothetical protein